jgi:hypothetical protein
MHREHHRRLLWLCMAALLWSCGGAVPARSADGPAPVAIQPAELTGRQGDVVSMTVTVSTAGPVPTGRWGDRSIAFFPLDGPGRFGALVGIDLAAPTGRQPLTVLVADQPVGEAVVVVERQTFPEQTLTLPDEMVQLDEPTLVRVKQEQEDALAAMAADTPERWWAGAFIMPTDGPILNSFGRRRIINGEPRNPHTGEDIAAPEGAPVVASNSGVVRLIADHFFSGHSVFIDHGDGLYTMYFHLSKALVAPSQRVRKGETIGLVGASGRATGPHLHWGARLNGARVNPLELTRLRVP